MLADVIGDAKKQFLTEYSSKIADLGYKLTAVLGWCCQNKKNVTSIDAVINYDTDIPKDVKKQIDEIIPRTYTYEEHIIQVKLDYKSIQK